MNVSFNDDKGMMSVMYTGNSTSQHIQTTEPTAILIKRDGKMNYRLLSYNELRYFESLQTNDTLYSSAFENTFPAESAILRKSHPEYFI